MAIVSRKTEVHWNYFLAIEDDLERLSRFVEFDERNFECFSLELALILLAAAAEVDVVCKQICKNLDPKSSADGINNYQAEILKAYPRITQFEVCLVKHGMSLNPWHNWKDANCSPLWWTAYNKIKHHRNAEYHRANLKNALNAVAGLYVMNVYLYFEQAKRAELVPSPRLLRPGSEFFGGMSMGSYEFGISYKL